MKSLKFLIIIYSISFSSVYSQSGWFWLNPTPQGNDLFSISCPNATVFYVVGKGGTIMKSTNAGNNWTIISNEQYVDYSSCSFVNENTGFIAAGSKVIRTTNSGNSIDVVLTDTNYFSMDYVYLVNSNTGYAVGSYHSEYEYNNTYCYKTTNLGTNWSKKIIASNHYPGALYFKNSITGFVIVDSNNNISRIMMTTNSGDNWNQKYYSTFNLNSFWFVNDLTGYCSGQKLLETTDGGNTWFTKYNQYTGYVCFVNSETGYSTFEGISKTTNGGVNWYASYAGNEIFGRISSYNVNNIIATGENGVIVKTETNGNQWVKQWKSVMGWDLFDVNFINETTGFIGGYGIILKTINAGLTWDTCYTNSEFRWFLELFFVNNNTGYVAEDDGVFKTTDCGLTWDHILNTGRHWTIFFVNENTGYTGGKYGSLMKTTNAGANWTNMISPSGADYESMYFTSVNTGFVVGEYGQIEKTTNGGNNWLSIGYSSSSWLNVVYFINSNTGFIAGGKDGYGIILKTTNAGINWFLNASKLDAEFLGLSFLNESTGYASGRGGSFIKTTNCGVSWDSVFPGASHALYDVHFINESTGFLVGSKGTILKTTTGGTPIGIKPISNEAPERFILYQNYPNPFNPSTKIKFSIPPLSSPLPMTGSSTSEGGDREVVLKIYDILGREVTTLVNEKLNPGAYEVEWSTGLPSENASNFSSGVYFYKLTVDGFSQTKKMILLK